MFDADFEYHRERATRELDLGLTADAMPAARAHLKLAALHMDRVRELAQSQAEARSLLTM